MLSSCLLALTSLVPRPAEAGADDAVFDVTKNLSMSSFFTQAVDTPFSIPVDRRFEVLATHNLVGAVIDAVRRR